MSLVSTLSPVFAAMYVPNDVDVYIIAQVAGTLRVPSPRRELAFMLCEP